MDKAQADLDLALDSHSKEKIDAAQAALDAANAALASAKDAVGKAKSAYDSAVAAKSAADAAVTQAQDGLAAKQQAAKDVADAQAKAEQGAKDAQTDLDGKNASEKQAEQKAADASDAVTKAQDSKAAADAGVTGAQSALDAANAALKSAQDALAEIQAKMKDGSAYFFEWLNSQNGDEMAQWAANTLRNLPDFAKSSTHLGQAGDATSIDNLKKALAFLQEANEYRQKEAAATGRTIPDLLISSHMMAISEMQLNWTNAQTFFDHAMNRGVGYNVGENLAAGYSDPFDVWYTYEKSVYDDWKASGLTAADYLAKHPGADWGHYTNLVDTGVDTTGFAVGSSPYRGFPMSRALPIQAKLAILKNTPSPSTRPS